MNNSFNNDRYLRNKKRKRNRRIKLAIIRGLIIFAVGILVGLLINVIKKKHHDNGKVLEEGILSEEINFDAPDDLHELIADNYYRYLKMAYIMIGDYPDCEYHKISAKVARDDYNFERDFYVKDGEAYYNYYPETSDKAEAEIAIDISGYQGEIDWKQVKSAGITVAMIRVGFRGYGESGSLNEDEDFTTYMKGAEEVGISTGAYFFSQAINYDEGVEEAEFVLSRLKGLKITEPIVIDTEYIDGADARANDISKEDRTAAVKGFCETVKKAGYTPMVYASVGWFLNGLDIEEIGDYEIWLAAYYAPDFPYHVEGWQYSPYGLVPGIDENNVDLNVWLRNKKKK